MAQASRTALKTYFESGDQPTEAQFIDLIDSFLNYSDDGVVSKDLPFSYFEFDAHTIDIFQGVGEFWFNNVSTVAATILYMAKGEFSNGLSIGSRISSLNVGATIRIANRASRTAGAIFEVSGTITEVTDYFKIPVIAKNVIGTFGAGNICGFDFVNPISVTRQRSAPTIVTNVLDIDFDSKNDYKTTVEVAATASFAVTLSNTTNADVATIDLHVTNSIVITLPTGSVMQDDEDRWTPTPTLQLAVAGGTGESFELSLNKVGTKLKWILSQIFE